MIELSPSARSWGQSLIWNTPCRKYSDLGLVKPIERCAMVRAKELMDEAGHFYLPQRLCFSSETEWRDIDWSELSRAVRFLDGEPRSCWTDVSFQRLIQGCERR